MLSKHLVDYFEKSKENLRISEELHHEVLSILNNINRCTVSTEISPILFMFDEMVQSDVDESYDSILESVCNEFVTHFTRVNQQGHDMRIHIEVPCVLKDMSSSSECILVFSQNITYGLTRNARSIKVFKLSTTKDGENGLPVHVTRTKFDCNQIQINVISYVINLITSYLIHRLSDYIERESIHRKNDVYLQQWDSFLVKKEWCI